MRGSRRSFLFFRGRGAEQEQAKAAAIEAAALEAAAAEPVIEVPPEPAGPTPEEIQAQLAEMIDSRSAEMEAKLKTQYDDRIKELQKQLDATQTAASEREAALREQQRLEAERKAEQQRLEAERRAAAEKAAAELEAAAAEAETAEETPAGTQQAAAGGGGGATTPRQAAAKPEPPPEPQVRLGDLVAFGPGVTPPDLMRMPDPVFPSIAKRLNKSAVVEVRVLVDEKGDVREAELAGAKAGYGFDQAAIDAAKRATYRPATKDGVRVKMWTQLVVRFKNT
jgi:TonB family protein